MSGENPQNPTEEPQESVEDILEQAGNGDAQDTGATEETLQADVQGFGDTDRVAQLEAELAEMKNKWMRAVADEQNVRRRSEREKQDALKYGVTNFAREMVSVADNMARALASAPEDLKDTDLMKGIEMTERELQSAFKKAGIKRVEALGQPFNHNVHQAMYEIDDPSQPAGMVAQVMQDGYVIHDRLLRPAMVGVTKGGPKQEAQPTEPPAEEAAAQAYGGEAAPEGDGSILDQET